MIEEKAEVQINGLDKVFLLIGCCRNKKLKRFVDKGQRYLGKELDLIQMKKDIIKL